MEINSSSYSGQFLQITKLNSAFAEASDARLESKCTCVLFLTSLWIKATAKWINVNVHAAFYLETHSKGSRAGALDT